MNFLRAFFLSFGHWGLILPLIIVGYSWISRRIFTHALCVLALSILLNIILKHLFQIPLSPTLGKEGFAFPSGHMQAATVLYGWLALNIQNVWARLSVAILLLGMGFSLVHAGYHNYYDVFGGVFFGMLLIGSYYCILLKFSRQKS